MRMQLSREQDSRIWLLSLGLYALLTLVMTYPVLAHLSTHLVGTGDDMWVHYWNNWWVKKALSEGKSVYVTRLLFHPQKTSLVYHNFGWVNIFFWLLLEPITGGIAAANVVHLLNITLCAFAAFLLARHLLEPWGPAFIVGLVYGYWPYRLSNYNHPNTISTQWLPLALLCAILIVRRRDIRHALLGGLFLALTGLSRWQMLLPAAIALGVYLLFSVAFERENWSWRVAGLLLLMALVTLLLIAIPFYPLARGLIANELGNSLIPSAREWMARTQTDLLSYIVPPVHHPLSSLFSGLSYAHEIMRFCYRPSAFLGYTVLVMTLAATAWQWEAARPWVTLALVALTLSLGPILRFNDHTYPNVPMPYRLVGWLGPMRWMRTPHRFNALLALPVAVLAGQGAAAIQEKVAKRRPTLLWAILALLVLFDYFNLPTAMVPAHVPDFYHTIANESETDDFALAGLPGNRGNTEYYMFYQTVHGHPLLAGHISRLPPEALSFISSVPLMDGVYMSGTINTDRTDISRQLSLLAEGGFRYIVLDKNLASSEQMSTWRSYLAIPPHYEDDEVVVYSTSPVVGRDCRLRYRLAEEIGLINANLSAETIHPVDELTLEATWGTMTPPSTDYRVQVALVNDAGDTKLRERFAISPEWPTSQWSANAIVRGRYSISINPRLARGKYDVLVTLLSQDGEPVGNPATIAQVTMEAPKHNFVVPPVEHPTNVTFGGALRLLGYDDEMEKKTVRITLHWQALRRMDTPYKFFVHLMDAESGQLVTQADVMPHNWTYPTTWWKEGEIVSDEISLPTEGRLSDDFQLWVGAYHPDTGERLSVSKASPKATVDDDRLLLLP